MSSILLPPAIIAKGLVTTSIPISITATAALAGYAGVVSVVITNLALATTSITLIQTTLTPSLAIAPPSKIGLNITASALAQIVTVNATIAATAVQAVAIAGLPSPTFPVSAALVTTQLTALEGFITTFLVLPQSV